MLTTAQFLEMIKSGRPLLADGAMGTLLHERGTRFEQCFDELNISQPGLVVEIHRDYIQAGAQLIKTNTFGANYYKLKQHSLETEVELINTAGVELARKVIEEASRKIYIAGDVGPLGVRLAPFGRVHAEQARQAFFGQILALNQAGADLLLIETMSDLYEISEAIQAARQAEKQLSRSIPVIASVTFTRDDRTLLGDSPVQVVNKLQQAGPDVIGINCSGGPEQLLRILKQMHQALPDGCFSVMPNAGWPEQVGGRIMYPAGPDYFGEYALAFWQAGASIVGGCCGTGPEHIKAMRQALDQSPRPPMIEGSITGIAERDEPSLSLEQATSLSSKLANRKFVVAVEMDPPRGLSIHKVLAGASLLAEAGADVIDVADSPMARMRMSPWAVCSLVQNQAGIETVLHFPTRGRNLLRVQGDLLAAHALGIRNVFVVLGDPTSIGDYPDAMDNFDLVPSGLIKLIKQGFNVGVDHSGNTIGQPTAFFVGCALNLNPPDMHAEIKNLQRKIKAGADFILTQPVFDLEPIHHFLRQYERENGLLQIPLIAGILPLSNIRHAAFLSHEVPGIRIPDEILRRMAQSGENNSGTGIRIAIELSERIKELVQGIYLMPAFSRFDDAAEIIEAVTRHRP